MLPSQISHSSAKSIRPGKPVSRHLGEESQQLYQTIATDRKYKHFSRIPSRIIRCLDYFGVNCDSVAVERRLRAYYLFIGVIDNAIDSGQWQVSQIVLRQFESPTRFDRSGNISEIELVTERLLEEVSDETYSEVLNALHALSAAVEHERIATSMTEYIEARKRVGQLTAKTSFLLIRPLLSNGSSQICQFMETVGEIGCLVDSVIDLDGDQRSGLLNFQSTRWDFIHLLTCAVKSGAQFSIRHPRLFGLFIEAVIDNLRDRPRARDPVNRVQIPTKNAATTTP